MKRAFGSRKSCVRFASYERSECFIEAVRLLLQIRESNASFVPCAPPQSML